MRLRSVLAVAGLAVLLLGACIPMADPTSLPATATQAMPPEATGELTPTAAPTAAVVAGSGEAPIYLAIIWHQHQPLYYKDPDTGLYAKPWVRLHAAKDYVDMATTLAAHPGVRETFNLTPSLIRQLDDLAAGAKDIYQAMAEKPAGELSAEDKAFIGERFFDINSKIIDRFPRYAALAAQREAMDSWTEADWRDLQVLFNLAWTDPDWLAEAPLKALVDRGRDFSEADKRTVLDRHTELVQQVIAEHKRLQDAGQIEITMTPYAHPILPLLVNTQLAKAAVPDMNLPSESFITGQDAQAQVRKGVAFYEAHFGRPPTGMWPAEGAVAQEIVGMVSRAGIAWMASDEDVLAKSLGEAGFARDADELVKEPDRLYRPYYVSNQRDDPVAIVFRDKNLSDKVGFTYSGTPGEQAAQDFVRRIHAIRDALAAQGKEGPHLVSVILDGENAWEHYDNDGKLFLNALYRLLAEDEQIVTVTPSDYLAMFPDQPNLENLWAGSWVTPDYKTWIGEDEENLAWDYLARTRAVLTEYERGRRDASPEAIEEALELIYAAEGSDWFWWYGNDQNSGSDDSFDEQFRATLGRVYDVLGEKRPAWLSVPIIAKQPVTPEIGASKLISPTIDGAAAAGEWDGAGSFVFEGGAMASSKDVLERLTYGFNGAALHLRVDARADWAELAGDRTAILGVYLTRPGGGPANAFSRFGEETTLLGFGGHVVAEVAVQGGEVVSATLWHADGENGWIADADLAQAAVDGSTLELAIPFEQFGQPDTGDQLKLRAVLSLGSTADAVDQTTLPAANPALVVVPDLGLSRTVLLVEDPEKDDKGPGTYTYPTDPVFPGQAYDLRAFEVAQDDDNVLFKLTFYGGLNNSWGAPNGMGVHTVDIYIDQDGEEGSGARKLLPGRNASVAAADAWDVAIWAEGWVPGIFRPGAQGPERADGDFFVTADPAQRKIIIRVPKKLLGDAPETWKYLAVVAGQEGYPSSGVWRVRDVNPAAEQWRFGGGPQDTNHTRIIDAVLPTGVDQFELLSAYEPSQEENMDALGPDDFAQLPMVGVE